MAPDTQVLDIATGNGALPRLLAQARPAGDWHCDAVDLAQVAPTGWPTRPDGRPTIRFHAGVQAEHLPFADARFDLVVSQYGLEYSDLAKSVPELLRVLVPQGRLALVVHHAASRPVTLAAVEQDHIVWLLSPQGLVGAARPMLEPLSRASTPDGRASLANDRRADAARERFNAAQDALAERARDSDGADVLFEAQAQVAHAVQLTLTSGLGPGAAALSALETALADARWRLEDLRRHAMNDSDVDALCAALRARDADDVRMVESAALHERGYLMGWSIRAGR